MKEQTKSNYILFSLLFIFFLGLYLINHDLVIIPFCLLGIYCLLATLYIDRGFYHRLFELSILLIFSIAGLILIYLFISTLNNPSRHLFVIFVIIVFTILIVYTGLNIIKSWLEVSKFNKGAKLLDQHQYKKGFDYFNEISKKNLKNHLAWAGKAAGLQRLNKTDEALELVDNNLNSKTHNMILAKKSLNSVQFQTIGGIYANLKDYEKALEYTDKALKFNPTSWTSLSNKGFILDNLGRKEEAITCFNKALRYNPKSSFALNNKGDVLRKLRNYQEATKYTDKALKSDPKIPDFWLTKGQILICMNKNEEALKYIDKALELDPDYKDAIKTKEKLIN
jgi:tetratricopeptide (TPR) repeat protein